MKITILLSFCQCCVWYFKPRFHNVKLICTLFDILLLQREQGQLCQSTDQRNLVFCKLRANKSAIIRTRNHPDFLFQILHDTKLLSHEYNVLEHLVLENTRAQTGLKIRLNDRNRYKSKGRRSSQMNWISIYLFENEGHANLWYWWLMQPESLKSKDA